MENGVPSRAVPGAQRPSLAARSVDRALDRRRAAYADEVQRLVEAGFQLIRETGELEPRVGAIVRAAGLSNQAFYRHFRSKDELLLTLLDEGVRRLHGYLEHRMAAVASPADKVRCWIEGMLEQALQDESASATRPFALSRARLAELFPDEVEASERQLSEMLERAIAAAREAGELAAADPPRDAETIYNLAMGWIQRKLAAPRPASRDDARHLLAFAMRGLRTSAPG